jgi:TolB protein
VGTDGSGRQRLLDCPDGSCGNIAWFPDGRRLIYERRNNLVPGTAPGPPHLWWLDLASAETWSVFQDSQQIGYGAGFSPDGQWLSYVSPTEQGVQLFHMESGEGFLVPTQMGGPVVWDPEGIALLLTDIRQRGEGFAVHLLRADLAGSELVDLSGEAEVEDSAPAWSPDGEWVAFGRKLAGVSMGRQIWLMRPDGSQARYLTAEPEIHYGEPEWSPDGRYLLFQAFFLREVGAKPSVWLFDLETDRLLEVVKPGSRPGWLP